MAAHGRDHMGRAIALARRGLGRVEPNPMVGCVIAQASCVISEGHHRRFGGPHAEIEALRAAAGSVRGATVYVSLEPCVHHGKTPPCTDALIEAGVKRVVAAMKDPNGEVAGRGIRRLRAAGIDVRVGCLREEARALNASYLTLLQHGRPWVVLKWAQSLDGQITTPPQSPKQISGPSARRWVHRLRGRVDGIIVGVGTVLSDNPRLTARGVGLRRIATRVVLDSQLRTDPDCKLVRTARRVPTLIMTTKSAITGHRDRLGRLLACGVQVERCRAYRGRVDVADALRRLGARRMTNVMVEGGGTVLRDLLRRNLADEAFVIVAPRLLGGPPTPSRGGRRTVEISPAPLEGVGHPRAVVRPRRLGHDVLYHIHFRQ